MASILPYALRELGPAALLRFGQYRLGLESGWIRRRTPSYMWEERPLGIWLHPQYDHKPEEYLAYRLAAAPQLFLPDHDMLRPRIRGLLGKQAETAIAEANRISTGSYPLFGFNRIELGFPPDWHRFAPLYSSDAGWRAPVQQHWSEINLLELPSDVKLLWELNRFGWVFPLVRAYLLTGEADYFSVFCTLFDSWRAANHPNQGLNWHSAQEVSIRMLALIFVLYSMQTEFAMQPNRVVDMAQTIAAHAERIPPTLAYAIAQGNNHLLLEAAGLYTVGLLFPEFRRAERWRMMGRRWLLHALRKQVFPDGGYVQQSVNYHRVALQAALWTARLAKLHGEPLPRTSLIQIERMIVWLDTLVDPETGAAPNFGPNDGAEILPFSMLPFDDHRPTLQAASWFLRQEPLYVPGLWDEWSLWLGVLVSDEGVDPPPKTEERRALPDSGLYKLSGERTRGYLRAGRFATRPGHADQMHLDLWFGSMNVAMDAGTYLYNAKAPWDNALSGTLHHNTILVDDSEAMIRASRFLWLDWNQAGVLGHWESGGGDVEALAAERFGDRDGEVTHRRTVVRAGENLWIVIDELLGKGKHRIDLSWLLPDLPWRIEAQTMQLSAPVGDVILTIESESGQQRLFRAGTCIHGDEPEYAHKTLGWYSPTYALKVPALQLINSWSIKLPLRIQSQWSWLGASVGGLQVGWSESSQHRLPFDWLRYENRVLEINDAYSVDPPSVRSAG